MLYCRTFGMIVVYLCYGSITLLYPHKPIHCITCIYVPTLCVFGFNLLWLRAFMPTHMPSMDRDKPLCLRPTRLSGNHDKYVKEFTKILTIKRFNYA